ncbi:MAG: hypothetical protein AB8B73_01660 [Ekhidna sp.]
MKALIILLFIPAFSFSQGKTANELLNKEVKKYSIQSGMIVYDLSGDATGSEELTFSNYGWSSLKKQTMNFELYGITSSQSIHEVRDGDLIYRLKAKDSTMSKRVDLKWSSIASYKTPEELSEAVLFSLGGTYSSDSTLNERKCQVWTFENKALKEMWIWEGLVMKRRTKLGNRLVISTAKKVDINVEVDPKQYEIPSYYTEKND